MYEATAHSLGNALARVVATLAAGCVVAGDRWGATRWRGQKNMPVVRLAWHATIVRYLVTTVALG